MLSHICELKKIMSKMYYKNSKSNLWFRKLLETNYFQTLRRFQNIFTLHFK